MSEAGQSGEQIPLMHRHDSPTVNHTFSSNHGVSTARDAFLEKDVEASRQVHQRKLQQNRRTTHNNRSSSTGGVNNNNNNTVMVESAHQTQGGLLKPIIFGGLDGILTSFAIVAGAAGGNLSPQVVLILGFSNIFADALSMGVGEFLSSKAENEWILTERAREAWEVEHFPESEIQEMIDIYMDKGMSTVDAELVVRTMAKYKDFYIDTMMTQELQLQVPEENHLKTSFQEGLIMFCSFACFGAMPLLGYIIIPILFPRLGAEYLFLYACVVTGMVLFLMGSVKSLVSNQHWFRAGMETLILGGTCATVAFSIGKFVGGLGGGDGGESL